jgi:hypothetical protein
MPQVGSLHLESRTVHVLPAQVHKNVAPIGGSVFVKAQMNLEHSQEKGLLGLVVSW